MGTRFAEQMKELIRPYYLRWIYFRLFPSARPPHFEDPWRYPLARVGKESGDLFAETSVAPDILFLPMNDWHARLQRSQQLALAFAKLEHRCIYLNPHLGREFPKPYPWTDTPVLSKLGPRIGEFHVHLWREPVFHHRCLTGPETGCLAEQTGRLLRSMRSERLIQIVSLPVWLELAVALRQEFGCPIVYDCHDCLSGFRGIAPEIVEREQELLRTCDLAVFSSLPLLESARKMQPDLAVRSMLVRNAVDSEHFRESRPAGRPAEVIGYVGALERWFDAGLISAAAIRHPEWRFVLLGRVDDENVLRLRSLPNVELRGEVPYAGLPRHVSQFAVGLIPFVMDDLTLAANPLKLYEYFSLGIPVVSSALPEVEQYGRLVYIFRNESEFVEQIEAALAEKDEGLRAARIAVAQRESWHARASDLLEAFGRIPDRAAVTRPLPATSLT